MTARTIIEVGPRPAPFVADGQWLDGLCPVAQAASVTLDDAAQEMVIAAAGAPLRWRYGDIRLLARQAGDDLTVLRHADAGAARLVLGAADGRIVLPRARDAWRRVPGRRAGRPLAWLFAAIMALALLAGVVAMWPDLPQLALDFRPPLH